MLTDNEKTVTTMHIAGIPVRNQQTVTFAKYYSVSLLTCEPADPASKGGVENAVKVAKADLVPKDTNLRAEYDCFAQLEQACDEFMAMINDRVHRTTKRQPAVMLAEERAQLHTLPAQPFTIAFGVSRMVPAKSPMISYENVQYSVPYRLLGEQVWVRTRGMGASAEVIIVHLGADGPTEVARHAQGSPGVMQVNGSHFPDREEKVPGVKRPKARSQAEKEFLALGEGAHQWLMAAAAAGAERVNLKMAEAVTLAKLQGSAPVDRALGLAAANGRFGHRDLLSILESAAPGQLRRQAPEQQSLSQGASPWADYGSLLKEAN
ncbi:hypothetical protein CIK76_18640 [Glutamicibacter sp. BW80]|uniref:Mu transposase domain-containing protein n=2 Tax=unclassified Glutamicibacter TaxID=2627139 RepID=UPI000BB99871|nr:hypothetical protein [Glutamicibacter sp. BW80]PCC27235.1 hypothetical protein CIK76_18640 [Glutamicibacter sp. BW80]